MAAYTLRTKTFFNFLSKRGILSLALISFLLYSTTYNWGRIRALHIDFEAVHRNIGNNCKIFKPRYR